MMFFDPRSGGAFLRLFIRGGAIYPIRQKRASPFRRRKGGSRRKFMGPARVATGIQAHLEDQKAAWARHLSQSEGAAPLTFPGWGDWDEDGQPKVRRAG